MSILILNAVSHARSPYEKILKSLGEDLILLSADKYVDDFPKEDYLHIESFSNYDDTGYVDLRAIELYEKYKYKHVISCYEFDVLRAAKIRETFHLQGQGMTSALMYRDKMLMKEMVRKNALPTPAFDRLNTPIDLIEFIKLHGYPVVVKPISGAGSQETFILKNREQLQLLLTAGLPPDMMVEAFVEGDIYHVDGIIVDGEVRFVATSKYLDALLNYKQETYTGGHLLHPTHPLSVRMADLTQQVVQALDTPENTAFHAEWFHTPNDEIIFCEIACRVGGGRINETLVETFGVDLFKTHYQVQFGLPYHLPTPEECAEVENISGRVLILKREGRFLSAPQEAPPSWVVHHELLAKPGELLQNPTHCVDLVAGFVVEGSTEQEVHEKLILITDWFDRSSHWE